MLVFEIMFPVLAKNVEIMPLLFTFNFAKTPQN